MKRGVLEEKGYKINLTVFLGVYKEKSIEEGTEVIAFMFTGTPIEQKPEELEEDIIQKKWFSPKEIPEPS